MEQSLYLGRSARRCEGIMSIARGRGPDRNVVVGRCVAGDSIGAQGPACPPERQHDFFDHASVLSKPPGRDGVRTSTFPCVIPRLKTNMLVPPGRRVTVQQEGWETHPSGETS